MATLADIDDTRDAQKQRWPNLDHLTTNGSAVL
jgi:hypothetical protein